VREPVLKALHDGVVVLTPTVPLARYLWNRYSQAMRDAGHRAWTAPTILALDDWLQESWHDIAWRMEDRNNPAPVLLRDVQVLALWRRIIEVDRDRQPLERRLLNIEDAARNVRAAARLLREWNLGIDALSGPLPEDTEVFVRWVRAFDARCHAESWITIDQLPDRVCTAVETGSWRPVSKVLWYGFDQLTPSRARLHEVLSRAGASVQDERRAHCARDISVNDCNDATDEILAAARWARALLERGVTGPVGVVFRDLGLQRDAISQVFRRVLAPDTAVEDPAHGLPFRVALGPRLSDHPVVAAGLALLALAVSSQPAESAARILISPFVAGGTGEIAARAALEVKLRDRHWGQVSPRGLLRLAREEPVASPEWAAALERGIQALEDGPAPRTPVAWAEQFSNWLSALGWPGPRGLNSAEFQAVQAFHDALSELGTLYPVYADMDGPTALHWVSQVCQRPFQPQTDPAPVMVLGWLEAAEMEFSHLWVAGMDAENWPPAPRPNPFLPMYFQRQHGMPGVEAAGELERARHISERLRGAAPDIVVSFARLELEQERPVSPLFPDLVAGNTVFSEFAGRAAQLCAQRPVLEHIRDARAPSLRSGAAPGGAGLLQDQSACQFRAFVRYRLRARDLAAFALGHDAMTRGRWAHRILAAIWDRLRDQDGLKRERDSGELAALVRQLVESELRARWPDDDSLRPALIPMERERMAAMIGEWLDVDAARPPFTVVRIEHEFRARIADITLNLRMDRMDRLEDGTHLLMDYKTGRDSRPARWFGTRPEEPQLPLYTISLDVPVGALAFATVRPNACGFAGIARNDTKIEGMKRFSPDIAPDAASDWEQQVNDWRDALGMLARTFANGEADVAPRTARDCDYCDVRPVCRIFEDVPRES